MYEKDCVSKTESKNVDFESTYRCRICDKSFRKFIIFEGHFAFNAKCRAKYGWFLQCYVCGETFRHLAVLKYHIRRHVNKNNCFKRSGLQSIDGSTNNPNRESHNGFNCNICQRNFRTNFYLSNHMVSHSTKPITKKSQINGNHGNTSSTEIGRSVKTFSFHCQICSIDCLDKTALGNVAHYCTLYRDAFCSNNL